ncbi:hypothetical protein GCM10009838_88990 [Catenulispora subtropica]|uniref:Uncharacterized protein n=1 Tax=Catenulispora subtropica TaxID=450798 RepID=A0ABP5EXY1_9ACTN
MNDAGLEVVEGYVDIAEVGFVPSVVGFEVASGAATGEVVLGPGAGAAAWRLASRSGPLGPVADAAVRKPLAEAGPGVSGVQNAE